jgi:hypothetical protein
MIPVTESRFCRYITMRGLLVFGGIRRTSTMRTRPHRQCGCDSDTNIPWREPNACLPRLKPSFFAGSWYGHDVHNFTIILPALKQTERRNSDARGVVIDSSRKSPVLGVEAVTAPGWLPAIRRRCKLIFPLPLPAATLQRSARLR